MWQHIMFTLVNIHTAHTASRTHHKNSNICCHIATPFLSTFYQHYIFIYNLNILSNLMVKWKQLNKEGIPDDDQ